MTPVQLSQEHRLRFRAERAESHFLDPRRSFLPTTEKLQIRFDPLTGRTSHLCHFGAIKPVGLDLARYQQDEVKGFCPFCGTNRRSTTPKFPADVLPSGRLSQGQALLIPNLFPYDALGALVVMTEDHVVPLDRFDKGLLLDALTLGTEFLRRAQGSDPAQCYPLMAWNYMPPSGGGLVHPHQQYFATRYPGNLYQAELQASEAFLEETGAHFWEQLVREERRRGERYIGASGDAHWLASFAPLGVLAEILCVIPEVFELADFTAGHADDLLDGLQRVFRYLREDEIHSFNATLVFGPAGQRHFAAHLRLIPRTFLNLRDFAPDLNFFQSLLQEPVSVLLPEDLCEALKQYFD